MARHSNRDDPLSDVRRLLREIRTPAARPTRRQAALLGAVEMALFRLPARQREIVQRYDLRGERASDVQRSLSLSARQFFRDRRRALAVLSRYLFHDDAPSEPRLTSPIALTRISTINDAALVGKTFARSLAQSGNLRCLEVLQRLAATTTNPLERTDLLLELVETAIDYSDEEAAYDALEAASDAIQSNAPASAIDDWLIGRSERARAHLASTPWESADYFDRSISFLRRSIVQAPSLLEPRATLSDVLGDHALLEFTVGSFARSQASSSEAVGIIESFSLTRRPKTLETLAMHETIGAVLSGRTAIAIAKVSALLGDAGESGWSSTAIWLGAIVVGLMAVSGDYAEAIRLYRTMEPLALTGARPRDRSSLMLEAAHAYTMTGQPKEALALLGYVRPGDGCPRTEIPEWHSYAAAALQRLGDVRSGLREASTALAGFTLQGPGRGLADSHRQVANCYAKLGNLREACEHIAEARRLTEHHGTPYQLLLTLRSQARILQTAEYQREAVEYAALLSSLARS